MDDRGANTDDLEGAKVCDTEEEEEEQVLWDARCMEISPSQTKAVYELFRYHLNQLKRDCVVLRPFGSAQLVSLSPSLSPSLSRGSLSDDSNFLSQLRPKFPKYVPQLSLGVVTDSTEYSACYHRAQPLPLPRLPRRVVRFSDPSMAGASRCAMAVDDEISGMGSVDDAIVYHSLSQSVHLSEAYPVK